MDLWSVLCGTAAVLSSFPLLGVVETSYRWTLLLTIPFWVYAGAGLLKIRTISIGVLGWRGLLVRNTPRIFAVALLLSGVLYVTFPAQEIPSPYGLYPGMIPSTMLQNTIPLSDAESVVRILTWLSGNSNSQTGLITHQAFYGWAREYFHGSATIINYGYRDPSTGIRLAEQSGFSSIVTIWWTNGRGWHGQLNPPDGFVPIQVDGSLAALEYRGPPT